MFAEAMATRHEAQSLQPLLQNQGCKAFTRRDASGHEITAEERPFRVAVSKQEAEREKDEKKKASKRRGKMAVPLLTGIKSPKIVSRGREPAAERALKILLHVVELL